MLSCPGSTTCMATFWSHLRLDIGSPPCADAGPTAAADLPPGPGLQNFWYQLAAVKQLSEVGSAHLLQLGNDARFPLEGNDVRGRLIVRRCYVKLSKILQDYIADKGHTFIITGSPGDSLLCGIQGHVTWKTLCIQSGMQQDMTGRSQCVILTGERIPGMYDDITVQHPHNQAHVPLCEPQEHCCWARALNAWLRER